jgi:ribonuclease HI
LVLGLQPKTLVLPQEATTLLQKWSTLCPFQTTKKGQISNLWRTLPKFILWKIWLERNNRLFRETKRSPTQVATKIKAYFGESAPYFCKAKNLRPLEPKEVHWIERFKLSRSTSTNRKQFTTGSLGNRKEEQDFEDWKRKENKHILFFDGASKGNPRLAGRGGVLVSPTGHPELVFAWGLGVETNNRAEALALWQGLNQAIAPNVQDLVIIGDSRLIIQALILRNKVQNTKLQHILEKFHLLLGSLRTYQLYHVLRKLNALADAEANKGALSSIGTLQVNGTTTNMEIP